MQEPILVNGAIPAAPLARITIYSHHFCLTRFGPRGRDIGLTFAKRYIAWDWKVTGGQYTKIPSKVYASANDIKTELRFHINALPAFLQMLHDFSLAESLFEWCTAEAFEPLACQFVLKPGWTAREFQVPSIDYLVSPVPVETPPVSPGRLLEFQTGKGKTISSLIAVMRIGQRAVGVIKPKYIDKWASDLKEIYVDFEDRHVVVTGTKELRRLLEKQAANELDEAFILISGPTVRSWISDYESSTPERMAEKGYLCMPQDLFPFLRAGVRLIDEGHEDFHFFFKLDTYSHVPRSITLTATLVTNDPFVKKMYELQYPEKRRMARLELDRYVDTVNVLYYLKAPEKVRTTEWGSVTYSHTAFEKSIIRHVPSLRNYFALIKNVVDVGFIQGYEAGEKCIVYAATVDMCTKLTEFLKQAYPHLDVRRYVEEDPYENAIDADIRVTTILSGGTGLDIKGLAVAIMTTAIESVQANIQAMGRLRERIGKRTVFYFLTAENQPKQMKYAVAKRRLMQERAKTYRELASGHWV